MFFYHKIEFNHSVLFVVQNDDNDSVHVGMADEADFFNDRNPCTSAEMDPTPLNASNDIPNEAMHTASEEPDYDVFNELLIDSMNCEVVSVFRRREFVIVTLGCLCCCSKLFDISFQIFCRKITRFPFPVDEFQNAKNRPDQPIKQKQTKIVSIACPNAGLRSYVCDICRKIFTQLCHLRRHLKRTHEVIRRYICGQCNKSYKSSSCLKKHKQAIHQASQPYTCRTTCQGCQSIRSTCIELIKLVEVLHMNK